MFNRNILFAILISPFLYGEPEEVAQKDPDTFLQMPANDMRIYPGPSYEPLPQIKKSVPVAVGLSMLVPGLGHTYLNEYGTASGIFGTFAGSVVGSVNNNAVLNLNMIANTWRYGVYAAYRDARSYNGQELYSNYMPNESLADLAYAPFEGKVLRKPEVWGGFLGAMTLAGIVGYLHMQDAQNCCANASTRTAKVISSFPVGIGEEAYFRGFMQPALMGYMSPTAAIWTTSVAFGLAHVGNTYGMNKEQARRYMTYTIPFLTAYGAYFGWVSHKNNSLKECVALHVWYDFTLFLAGALATGSITEAEPTFSLSIPF